jgi:uncharacterized membrane protein YedE/YeeE
MIDYLTRQARAIASAAVSPVEAAGNRFVGMIVGTAGFATLALVCLIGTVIFLSIALDLWLTQLYGPVIGALGAAGLYFVVTLLALVLLLARRAKPPVSKKNSPTPAEPAANTEAEEHASNFSAEVESTVAPFVAVLSELGLKREEVAVRLAAEASKQMGPLTLVGLALIVGFLAQRSLEKPPKSS